MGALDCVNRQITPTESTEVFTVNMSSNTTLNVPRRDLESQSYKPKECSRRHSVWWTLAIDVPLVVIVLALIGLFEFGVIPNYKAGFYCNDPALSFPNQGETVNTTIIMTTLLLMPIAIFLPTEYVFGNSDDPIQSRIVQSIRKTAWLYRTYAYGLMMNLCIVEVMKGLVGSPRPIFFDLCQPDTAKTCNGSEFVPTFECTSTTYSWWYQMDSYRSFPSGHTSMSVYCGFFIAWYLQKRAFDWSHRSVIPVPILQLLCVSYAIVCSLTRITDHRHHWWDVLTGAAIGILTLLYAVIFLSNNFSYNNSKSSNDAKSEESQQTVRTLLFDERERRT